MRPSKSVFDSISLQERDLSLLRGLLESRVMTAAHIADLYFEGKSEATKKRLQKFKAAGLIGERKRRAYEPSILFLGRTGLTVLRSEGILTEYPQISLEALEKRARVSALTLRHELEVMDAKVAFHKAIGGTGVFKIAQFTTWPLLYQFQAFRPGGRAQEVLVKPDGFIRIHEDERDGGLSEHTFFLEIDRSTETLDTLVNRAGCYLDHFQSGGFAHWNGAPRSAFKDYPFRVLMIFKTAERRNNVAERLLQTNPPIFTQVCLSTFGEAIKDPLGKNWSRPIDYRDATKGTPFDPENKRQTWGYSRQTERELFVEQRLKKFPLLG